MTGQTFGRLTVLRRSGSCRSGAIWLCLCECGNETKAMRGNLTNGHVRSCGCLAKEVSTRHGMSATPPYVNWVQMLARCENPKSEKYSAYGGRGINVCAAWHDFAVFYSDMGPPPSPAHTLDRKNNDGDYCPENCRWATSLEQMRNRRNSKIITVDDVSMTQADWARFTGKTQQSIYQKLKRGLPAKVALGLS